MPEGARIQISIPLANTRLETIEAVFERLKTTFDCPPHADVTYGANGPQGPDGYTMSARWTEET
jgi:hypothetical protein